jgi:GcrA cell cycle regulator
MTYHFAWTDEAEKKLTDLWEAGFSATEIARLFDGAISRNAVLGKVDRLRLPSRTVTVRKTSLMPPAEPKPRPVAKPKPAPVEKKMGKTRQIRFTPPEPLPPYVPGQPVGLMQLKDGMCRWPADSETDQHMFCALPVGSEHSSYCPHHRLKAYVPKAEREQKMRRTAGHFVSLGEASKSIFKKIAETRK